MTRRYDVTVTTDGSGAATAYSPRIRGRLNSIHYVKTDFADGVDFTITDETTGESLWTDTNINTSEIVRPRAPVMDQSGAARLYASGGTAVSDQITLGATRIKIVIASGGDTKTGTFRFVID